MLRVHHVVVRVVWKPRVHSVARLARLAMADAVGKDDEVARGVERRAGAVEDPGEVRAQELRAGARGAVENEHGVRRATAGVLSERAKREVMESELWKRAA